MVASKYFITCALLATSVSAVVAQNRLDSSKRVLLASADLRSEKEYIIKEANVIFPEILKGNEEKAVAYISSFSDNRRGYLQNMRMKSKKMLPQVNTVLKKYNLPEELAVLMLMESAGDGNAISKAGAVGYWQFMDEVAKEYGLKCVKRLSTEDRKKMLKKNPRKAKAFFKALARQKDDRKNFNKSTLAAARYLHDRSVNLDNDWLLVVASYNCGVGNVWNAMEKSGKTNPTFWDVKKFLPAETQAYVMNFITLNVIFNNYDNFTNNNLSFTPVKIKVPDNCAFVSPPEME
ncbi:lytic transglycosylase domain-containing protein [Ferruginibacter paludis]|uniref:lytic transglycosylase domain-containing protein n=1 Tax=Ferruginibacter paludis TaxID=1310417 RepID=UPI0025B616EF|nr:lytic transglycosylase domain-containing protein [Ferruginibacter paludis]MDN3658217.1 lytic transglycosylase domain-containing protein [Ferruginibacter paludis]